jgi:hypothetical protein
MASVPELPSVPTHTTPTCVGGDCAPVAGAVLLDVGDEDEVLLGRPRPLLHALLFAARRPPHGSRSIGTAAAPSVAVVDAIPPANSAAPDGSMV